MRHAALSFSLLFALALLAGCPPVEPLDNKWGEPYEDVVVPNDFTAYDNPPFKREDSKAGKRIYGVYSYRSKDIYSPATLSEFLKQELPRHGWTFVNETMDAEKATYASRFEKGGDKLDITMAPDKKMQTSERFSILVVKMNDPDSN